MSSMIPTPKLHTELVRFAAQLGQGLTAADLLDIMEGDRTGTVYVNDDDTLTDEGKAVLAEQLIGGGHRGDH